MDVHRMNIKKNPLYRRTALVVGAAAVLLLGVACTPTTQVTVAGGDGQSNFGISVTGEGRVTVAPDMGVLNLGIEVSAPTVAEARGAAADAMDAMQTAMTGLGVEARDISTQYFNIYPQYSYAEGRTPEITGFTVSNQVSVKVRNIDNVSAVLDAAIEAGGNAVRVNGISFTVENPEQHLADARRDAVENARAHAEVLATAAGVTLGAPLSINESFGGYPPYYGVPERAFDGGMGGGTPVNPGEQELSISVSVLFSISE